MKKANEKMSVSRLFWEQVALNFGNCPGSLAVSGEAEGFCEDLGIVGEGVEDFPALLFGGRNE